MAFTEAQEIKLAMILGKTPDIIATHLTSGYVTVSADLQTAIEAQITLWDAGAGTKTTRLHPTESNKGVETNPSGARAIIQKNIAVMLERPEWGGGSSRLSRG